MGKFSLEHGKVCGVSGSNLLRCVGLFLDQFPVLQEKLPVCDQVGFTRRSHRALRVFIPRFLGAIAYLVVLTVVGTVGYVAIEGWPWREALYV